MPRALLTIASVTLATLISTAALACNPTYVVQRGDTLSKIAAQQLGSVFDYRKIYDANLATIGPNPNLVRLGMRLDIPCGDQVAGDINWSIMPNPKDILPLVLQKDVQVLDIRSADKVANGVVPGAIWIPFENWRGPEDNLGEPISPVVIADMIGGAGLHLDRPIVVVHHEDKPMQTGASALVYWLLKSSGADQIAIMRGGFSEWYDRGLPIADSMPSAKPYAATVAFSREWRADEVDVYNIASGQADGVLLDARPHSMFERFDDLGKALASTIPGSHSLPAPSIMSVLGGKVNVENGVREVISAFDAADASGTDGPVITFCHVGELGALNWFYASELAGLPNIQLYPESINGWTLSGGRLGLGRNS